MTSRGPVLATAVVALAVTLLLWLSFGARDEAGRAVAPGAAPETAAATRPVAKPAPPAADELPGARAVTTPRPAAPGAVERSAVPGAWSAPLRGQVVDARTDEGVPGLVVEVGTLGQPGRERVLAGEDGRFQTGRPYEESHLVLKTYPGGEGPQRTIARRKWHHGADAGELLWRVDVGPSYRVDVVGGPLDLAWKARLVDVGGEGEERAWSWVEVDASEGWPGRVLYAEVEHEPGPRWSPRLQVADADERWFGETPVAASVGQHRDPVRVVVEGRVAALQGKVTDLDGEPVDAHVLLLLRNADEGRSWLETGTDFEGEFTLEEVPGGVHRLMILTDHRPIARFDVVAVPGEVTTQDVVLPRVVLAGDVKGALVGPPGGGDPFATVQLEGLDGASTNLAQTVGFNLFSDPDGADRAEFAFEGLPAGRYRVRVIPIDGRRFDRTEAIVGVPAENVLFVTDDREGEEDLRCVLTVTDAVSGEVLPEVSILWRLGPFWSADVLTEPGELEEAGMSPSLDLTGVVNAPDHLPARFSMADFQRDGDALRLNLALERGHGGALVILDAERLMGGAEARLEEYIAAEGLAGARVVAGGRAIGASDGTGLALLSAPAPIESFDVRVPGWAVFARLRFENHAETPDGIGFVLMARE